MDVKARDVRFSCDDAFDLGGTVREGMRMRFSLGAHRQGLSLGGFSMSLARVTET